MDAAPDTPLGPPEPNAHSSDPVGASPNQAPIPLRAAAAAEVGAGTEGGALTRTFYEQVGGHDTFDRLVTEFYRGVADDPVLEPMYPEEDLGPAADRLRMFLEQYWGGPTTYSEQRGHPRLRARHIPFHINPDARDRWLAHMRRAVGSLELPPADEALLWDYLERAAFAMVNTFAD